MKVLAAWWGCRCSQCEQSPALQEERNKSCERVALQAPTSLQEEGGVQKELQAYSSSSLQPGEAHGGAVHPHLATAQCMSPREAMQDPAGLQWMWPEGVSSDIGVKKEGNLFVLIMY